MSDLNKDKIAELAHEMVMLARDAGDTVYILKAVASACAVNVPGVQRRGEHLEVAAASLLMTTTSIAAVEVGSHRGCFLEEIARSFDRSLEGFTKRARS